MKRIRPKVDREAVAATICRAMGCEDEVGAECPNADCRDYSFTAADAVIDLLTLPLDEGWVERQARSMYETGMDCAFSHVGDWDTETESSKEMFRCEVGRLLTAAGMEVIADEAD